MANSHILYLKRINNIFKKLITFQNIVLSCDKSLHGSLGRISSSVRLYIYVSSQIRLKYSRLSRQQKSVDLIKIFLVRTKVLLKLAVELVLIRSIYLLHILKNSLSDEVVSKVFQR